MSERDAKPAEELPEFAWSCIRYADAHGRVISKRDDPFASGLTMELDKGSLHIHFKVSQSPYSNGSLSVTVKAGDKTVLEAKGKYIGKPFEVEITTYVPGEWEDTIVI